jgi:hypothetical protein
MIVGIAGGLGSGKTLLMTRYLKQDSDAGRKVYANYGLRNMEYEKLDMGLLVANELDLQNASIGIDELTLYMDARSSMGNKYLSYFILQSRKRNVCLYYTTQNINMIDRRVREHTMVYVYCKDIGIPDQRLVQIMDFRKGDNYVKPQLFKIFIKPWFKYFDTNETLVPVMRKWETRTSSKGSHTGTPTKKGSSPSLEAGI